MSNLCELLGDEEEIIKGAISTLNRFGFIEKYTEIDMELTELPSGSENDDFQIPASPTPAEKGIVWVQLIQNSRLIGQRIKKTDLSTKSKHFFRNYRKP